MTVGLGLYGMSGGFRGAKGGLMDAKAYREGGKAGYSTGGDISMMTVEQLQNLLGSPSLTPIEQEMVEKRLMLLARIKNNPESQQIMGGRIQYYPIWRCLYSHWRWYCGLCWQYRWQPSKVKTRWIYLAQYTDKKGNIDLNKAALSLLGQSAQIQKVKLVKTY